MLTGTHGLSLQVRKTKKHKEWQEQNQLCVGEWGKCGRTGGGGHGAVVLAAGGLEDEVREGLGAARGLGRAVACEVVERGGEDGADVEFAREVDDVDRRGDLVARVVVAVGRERHAFAAVPVRERRGEVRLQALEALSPRDADEVLAGQAEDRCEEREVLHKRPTEVSAVGQDGSGSQPKMSPERR